ncbi:MAG TPA: hypothetical protein PKY20_04675 [Methanothrix sp.]|nr:hypothetical protein [Methanothrix sp.]HOU71055.1 hypothetical protein [Methanothrix sp.]HQE97476.1 hypothetical protein [Methanothrix sp.]HQJ80199.1 hypothetical protein [Methanothrix sp.]HUM80287.1 hypothetical protein [Methanothrix sp.]
MRFNALMLSSFIFSSLLAMTALGVDWTNPSFDVDEMFHSGESEEYVNPVGHPATPQEARELQKNKSALNWTMPSTLSAGGESAKESREQAQSTNEPETSAPAEDASTTEATTSPATLETANVQGTWFFTLNDSVVRDAALTLLQVNGDVYGSGRIREENASMDVAVSGTAAGSDLNLDLVSTNPIIQYKLNLTVDQDLASGEYQASSASGESWTGIAEGQKTS